MFLFGLRCFLKVIIYFYFWEHKLIVSIPLWSVTAKTTPESANNLLDNYTWKHMNHKQTQITAQFEIAKEDMKSKG